ncbi:MAG: tetratricopeptide repeat protein [Cyanobium sp.]|jgi:tetratricopeptide (TPR) repeat protein
MQDLLPQTYLIGLILLLAAVAVVVGRQVLRVQRDERTLARLGGEGSSAAGTDASTLYELASVQLRKRLYGQATDTLKQALRLAQAEKAPDEARALIENALGFGLAAQNRFPAAIRHYRSALQCKPDYPVALNNLAYALSKQGEADEAKVLYERTLSLDPGNGTARKGLRSLERRRGVPSGPGGGGSGGGGTGTGEGGKQAAEGRSGERKGFSKAA